MNKFVTIAWSVAFAILPATASHAVVLIAAAPEASTNIGFGLMLVLGAGVLLIARNKALKNPSN